MQKSRYFAITLLILILGGMLAGCRAVQYADDAVVVVRKGGPIVDDVAGAARGAGSLTDDLAHGARTAGAAVDEAAVAAAVVAANSADETAALQRMVAAQGDDLVRGLANRAPLTANQESEVVDVFTKLVCLYADYGDEQDIEENVAAILAGLSVTLTPVERFQIIAQAHQTSGQAQTMVGELARTITFGTILGCTLDN
jgi:hypothetical protein